MKQFVKRLACVVLATAMIGILVGCSREAPSVTTNSDRAPVGYKAIAAMNASAAEKADRSVRTMSQEDKIGQFLYNSKGDDKKSDDAPAQSEDHTNVEPTPGATN